MDSILTVDQELVTDAVRTMALTSISAYQNGVSVPWHEAELGIYMVYIFGEINKSGMFDDPTKTFADISKVAVKGVLRSAKLRPLSTRRSGKAQTTLNMP